MDDLTWLTRWYASACDGKWEHSYGVKLDTIDNPGWHLSIDLRNTQWEDLPFERIESDDQADENHWYLCRVLDSKFDGVGGAYSLTAIVRVFRDWVESAPKS